MNLILSILFFVFVQDQKIINIRDQYKKIQSEIETYDFKKTDHDISSERGEITGFYDSGLIKKIVLITYGSIGQEEIEFYYDEEGLLFFVYSKELVYKMDGVLDPSSKPTSYKIEKSIENRYYFYSRSIIQWLDSKSAIVDSDDELEQMENRLLNLSDELCEKIGNL